MCRTWQGFVSVVLAKILVFSPMCPLNVTCTESDIFNSHKFFDSYIVKTKVCIEKKPATHTQATKNKIGSYIGPKHEGSDLFILKDEEFVVYGLGCAADSDENMLGDGRFGLEMVMAKVTGTETDAISPRKRVFSTTTSSRFLVFCDWDEAPS